MAVRRLADAAIQPKSFAFTVENLDWAKGEIAKYPEGRQASAILALLWRAQEQAGGWLPQKAIEQLVALNKVEMNDNRYAKKIARLNLRKHVPHLRIDPARDLHQAVADHVNAVAREETRRQ